MGVLACDRKGCDNIMCDNISHERNEYLCWQCKQELKDKGFCDIDAFMNSEPKRGESSEAWEKYVDELFVNRYEEG